MLMAGTIPDTGSSLGGARRSDRATTRRGDRGGTGGQDNVDVEFEKHFEFSCFDPNGRTVQEKLIEERLYND